MGGHESADNHYGESGYGEDLHDNRPEDKPMTRVQMFMQKSVFTWPLYTIVISIGQLLCAVSILLEEGFCASLTSVAL
jgi:alpha-1,3-glucan synthase